MAGSFSGSLNFDRSCSLSFVWIFYYVRMVSHNDNRNDSASKNKANFLSFIIPWFVGFVGCLVVVFVIL